MSMTARGIRYGMIAGGGVIFAAAGFAGWRYLSIAGWVVAAIGAVWHVYAFLRTNRRPR